MFFYMYKYIFFWNKKSLKLMILKEKNVGSKAKILRKYVEKWKVFKGSLQKVHKIFLYILLFRSILSIFFILRKKTCISKRQGVDHPPPPLPNPGGPRGMGRSCWEIFIIWPPHRQHNVQKKIQNQKFLDILLYIYDWIFRISKDTFYNYFLTTF